MGGIEEIPHIKDMKDILTVTELTANIKILLETSFDVLWVAGEISNLRRPGSGHVYFTLKDRDSQIRAVIFRQAMQKTGFDLEDGMEIVCRAQLNVYQVRGEYQLIIDAAEPRGYGALQMAFEQLKRKLDEEGLFDSSLKKKIPFLPPQDRYRHLIDGGGNQGYPEYYGEEISLHRHPHRTGKGTGG